MQTLVQACFLWLSFFFIFIGQLTAQDADSLKLNQEELSVMSSKRGKNRSVKCSGSMRLEVLYSDRKQPFQTLPASYARLYMQPRIDLGILPFSSSLMLSTEQLSISHQLNTFSLGFDYATFSSRLLQQISKRRAYEDSLGASDSLLQQYGRITQRSRLLKKQLETPQYQREIQRSHKIVLNAPNDSLGNSSKNLRVQQAREKIAQYESARKELDSLEQQIPTLERYKNDKRVKGFDSHKPGSLNEELKKYGMDKPIFRHLLAIRRLDLGNSSPDYSELSLRGSSLNGVNIEYNPGRLYSAFVYGKTVNRYINPFANDFRGGRKIMAARLGYGRADASLLCVTLMKGWEGSNSLVQDSNFVYHEPSGNTVLSLLARIKLKENFNLEAEYAGSVNEKKTLATKSDGPFSTSSNQQLFRKAFKEKGTQAMYIKLQYRIPVSGTELSTSYRHVQSAFYSFGNPFLRPDNKRLEGQAAQFLLKKQIRMSMAFRKDEDNTLQQKEKTSITSLYNYTLDLRLRRKPFFILNYIPSRQYYKGSSRQQALSLTRVYTLTAGHLYKIRRHQYVSTLVYSQQSIRSTLFQWNYKVQLYSLNQQVLFKKGLQLQAACTHTRSTGKSDSLSTWSLDAGAEKLLQKKYRLAAGFLYMYDQQVQARNAFYLGASCPWASQGSISLRAEQHWVDEKRKEKNNYTQVILRLSISKNF